MVNEPSVFEPLNSTVFEVIGSDLYVSLHSKAFCSDSYEFSEMNRLDFRSFQQYFSHISMMVR